MGAAMTNTELKRGDVVKVIQWSPKRGVPQHLVGEQGTVGHVGRTRAVVVCDDQEYSVPFGMLTAVPKPTTKAKMGAKVMYCGHDGWFVADIFVVGDACVVKANGRIGGDNIVRGRNAEATHVVVDFPKAGCWSPERGFLIVPAGQVKVLDKGGADSED